MQIFFSPEVITPHFQALNVVTSEGKAVGNVAFMFDEKKIYVYGILEEEGVAENFKSMLTPYIKGLRKAKEGLDIYACVYTGCKKITLIDEEEEKED